MLCAAALALVLLAAGTVEPTWHSVATIDASQTPLPAFVIEGSRYTYPEEDIPKEALAGAPIGRDVIFGSQVRISLRSIKPSARYRFRAWFLSDSSSRVQNVTVGGKELVPGFRLLQAKPFMLEREVPPSATSSGRLELCVGRVEGPNAVLSRLELLSTDRSPLNAPPSIGERLSGIGFSPRLTPRPDENWVSLNGVWQFCPAPPAHFPAVQVAESAWKPIRVPGEWTMQGFDVKPDSVVAYRRGFTAPAHGRHARLKLRFDTVHSSGSVWVNGVKAGDFEGVFTPFEFDITGLVKPGHNELALAVRSASMSDTLASASQYAAHPLGGILRKVTLFAVPTTSIGALDTVAKLGRGGTPTQLNVTVTTRNEGATQSIGRLSVQLRDPDGKPVKLRKRLLGPYRLKPGREASIHTALAVPNAKLWDPEHPRLYTLTVQLTSPAGTQSVTRRIGLRDVRVVGNRLIVNGRPVKLHGVNRHEVHPLLGRSLTPELCREDAKLFRQANCNYIRTSHYPPSEEFLDACDELGLFVECEAPLCWIQHGANPTWRDWDYQDERVYSRMLRANLTNVVANRLHPCVIIWSLGNESLWSPLWAETLRKVKTLDPSRPTSFHDQCWGSFNDGGSKADIAVYHYPSENGPAACDREARPVLFGEYAHVQTYNRREVYTDPGVRDDWGRPLARMVDLMWAHDGCLGGAIWSGIDDTFHLPNGKIVGYGPWGAIDGWRRPKPEYWHVARAYTPIHVIGRRITKASRPELLLVVENRYDFTNLSEVGVTWTMGNLHGKAESSGAPHRTGAVTMTLPRAPKAGETIAVRFVDPRGFVCEEAMATEGMDTPRLPAATGEALDLSESAQSYAIGNKAFSVEVTRSTGQLSALSVGGRRFAASGPVPMVLPLNEESGGSGGNDYQNVIEPFNPECTATGTPKVSAHRDGDGVIVSVNGRWAEVEGGWEARISSGGQLNVHYRFTVMKALNPRQWGLVFHLPCEMDTLRWVRAGSPGLYPSDHIGRTYGQAKANPVAATSVEAWRVQPRTPWSSDSSPMGTNDFRSTKSKVLTASLSAPDGLGVEVLSDCTQAVRAFAHGGTIGLLVAGFNTGGSEGFFGMHYAAERHPLKVGDVIEDTVVFRLLPAKQ